MTYEAKKQIPEVETYIRIRREAGLSAKSEEAASIGLKNSLFGVVIYHDDAAVGMGRVVGDGGCFFEVVDISVVPKHQKKGVGDLIMKTIMEYLRTHAPKTAFISLHAGHGTIDFYRRHGFETATPPDRAGMFQRIL